MEPLPFADNENNVARVARLMAQLASETAELVAKEREEHRRVYGREA